VITATETETKNNRTPKVREISFHGMMDWPDVELVVTFSRKTVWLLERNGLFPARRQLSPGRVGWWGPEILKWLQSRPIVGEAITDEY